MSNSRGNVTFRAIDLASEWIEIAQDETPQISINLFYILGGKTITSVDFSSRNLFDMTPISLVNLSSLVIEGNYIKFNTNSGIQKDRYLLHLKAMIEDGSIFNVTRVIKII